MTVAANGAPRKRTPARKPAAKPGTRDAVKDVLKIQWATPEMLDDLQGPPCVDVFFPQAGIRFLILRLSLVELAASGLWPAPLTRQVRELMRIGVDEAQTPDAYDDVMRMLHRLAVASVMIPPDGLATGDMIVDDVTADDLVPMFVMYHKSGNQYTDAYDEPVDPKPRQKVLVGPESQVPPGGQKWQRLHPADLSLLGQAHISLAPGALSRFLPEQTVDVASMVMAEVRRQANVRTAGAGS